MMGGSVQSRVINAFTYVCIGVRISVFQVEPKFIRQYSIDFSTRPADVYYNS